MSLVEISRTLSDACDRLAFGAPVAFVYNPLAYARAPHEDYLSRYGKRRGRVVLVGMNPGPFGMAQTGVPFGDPTFVKDWMGIRGAVQPPKHMHPKRPVVGLDSTRSEVSGTRLYGWASERFGTAKAFFGRFFIINYCPLVFMEDSGRNRVPEKLPAAERGPLFEACDQALGAALALLCPTHVVGVGKFAEERARSVLGEHGPPIGRILHPSPASPAANRGWAAAAEKELAAFGIV